MFLQKLEENSYSTSGKINKIKLSKILFFSAMVIIGFVFSSLTEKELAAFINTATHSSSFSGGNDELLTINSK